jgi:hypothetical protein
LIEQAMYFALGFLVAGLLSILFLPAFWRRALRLSMRRLQMLAPMSMEEVIAERDLLRAEFAVRELRMEQQIENLRAAKAADMATIGRHLAHIAQADVDVKNAEAERLSMEIALREAQKVVAERTDLLHSTELALHEMAGRAGEDLASLSALDVGKLRPEKESQVSRVDAHQAKIVALHDRSTELHRDLENLREEYGRVAEEAARAPELSKLLEQTTEGLDIAERDRQAVTKERDQMRIELAAAHERRLNEVNHLENALRIAREEARGAADKLEAARADNAMLHGAVETLRAERTQQRRAGGESSGETPGEEDVAALREALSSFGERVRELSETNSGR